jgi:hypothetical protein
MSDALPAFLTRPVKPAMTSTAEPSAAPPTAPKPPSRGKRLDWRRAARLLAEGRRVEDVAKELCVPAARLHRNLRRSTRFRDRISAEGYAITEETALSLTNLSYTMSQALAATLKNGDPKVVLWVAERVGLGGARSPDAYNYAPPRTRKR